MMNVPTDRGCPSAIFFVTINVFPFTSIYISDSEISSMVHPVSSTPNTYFNLQEKKGKFW